MSDEFVKQVRTGDTEEWWQGLKPGDTIRAKPSSRVMPGARLLAVVSVTEHNCICKNMESGACFDVKIEGLPDLFELCEKAPVEEESTGKIGFLGVYIGDVYMRDETETLHVVTRIEINEKGAWVSSEQFGMQVVSKRDIDEFKSQYTPVKLVKLPKSHSPPLKNQTPS